MNGPLTIAEPLSESQFRDIWLSIVFDYHKWDTQYEDVSTLARFPLMLEQAGWDELCKQSEQLWTEVIAAEREVIGRPQLLKRLGFTSPVLRALMHAGEEEPSKGMARVIRFDFHFATDGWRISEANADVPGGFIESCEFTRLMSKCYPGTSVPGDTSAAYAEAILHELKPNSRIGFVHATAYTDDRQVMFFLADRFSKYDLLGVLLSPADLDWHDGRAQIAVYSERLDGLVRFFPGEWLPNIPRRHKWQQFFYGSKTPISNPGYALITQSKRFPLIWDQLKTPMSTWKSLLPETQDPREVNWQDGDGWVLKPALGRVGAGIGMRGVTPEKEWCQIVRDVRRHPGYWVVQRQFTVLPVEGVNNNLYPCIGVFVIDGKACGMYGRISRQNVIDGRANDVAVIIRQAVNHTNGSPARLYSMQPL